MNRPLNVANTCTEPPICRNVMVAALFARNASATIGPRSASTRTRGLLPRGFSSRTYRRLNSVCSSFSPRAPALQQKSSCTIHTPQRRLPILPGFLIFSVSCAIIFRSQRLTSLYQIVLLPPIGGRRKNRLPAWCSICTSLEG